MAVVLTVASVSGAELTLADDDVAEDPEPNSLVPLAVDDALESWQPETGTGSWQSGMALYQQKCGRCHTLYNPSDFSAGDWPTIVRSHKADARLSEAEIRTISEYLVGAAGGGLSATESYSGDQASQSRGPVIGGYLYTEYFQTPEKAKNFDIHYLNLSISGWANDQINYVGEFELEHGGTGGSNTFVEQAFIDFWFVPNVALKIGALLTPFNRFDDFHDPLNNYAITRPQVAREIGVSAWKEVGVDLHGYFDVTECISFGFDCYTVNGLGSGSNIRGSRQYRDNNEDLAFGYRLSLIYCDDLEAGFSAYQGSWDDDGLYDVSMYGGHFLARTALADFYGEVSCARSENPAPTAEGRMFGYFIQASRLIHDCIRPTVRYGSLDYLDLGSALGRTASKGDMDLKELALVLAYYPTPKVVFKFEYTFFMEGARKVQVDNDQVGLQAAIRF